MKISVITPTFNSAQTIERNIKSVNVQEHSEVEHIFIDNVSQDETLNLIKSTSTRLPKIISEKDRGISDAFNKGIRNATGEIIAILNSDDSFYEPRTLSRVHQAFQDDPERQFVYGDMVFVDDVYGTNIRRPLECPVTHAMPFNHPAFFVRRSFYDKLGLFDEDFKYAMDFEFITRMYPTPSQPRLKGFYLRGKPLAIMYAGGASWSQEWKALEEAELALKKNGLWECSARRELKKRKRRIQIKSILSRWGLTGVVKIWRSFKWKKTDVEKG